MAEITSIEEVKKSYSPMAQSKLDYMKEHQPELYLELVRQGTLNEYLKEFSSRVSEMTERIAQQMGGDANAYACAREFMREEIKGY